MVPLFSLTLDQPPWAHFCTLNAFPAQTIPNVSAVEMFRTTHIPIVVTLLTQEQFRFRVSYALTRSLGREYPFPRPHSLQIPILPFVLSMGPWGNLGHFILSWFTVSVNRIKSSNFRLILAKAIR